MIWPTTSASYLTNNLNFIRGKWKFLKTRYLYTYSYPMFVQSIKHNFSHHWNLIIKQCIICRSQLLAFFVCTFIFYPSMGRNLVEKWYWIFINHWKHPILKKSTPFFGIFKKYVLIYEKKTLSLNMSYPMVETVLVSFPFLFFLFKYLSIFQLCFLLFVITSR